jgi:4-hydroxy-2-oxoheptanedioate aldolase
MKSSRVLACWRKGRPAVCAILHLADPALAEMAVSLPFVDCIWLDFEHGPLSIEPGANFMRAARLAGCDFLARPGKGEFMRMGRMLEQGANGIMYPRCESPAEAREFVRWAKFAPLGERGFAGDNAEAGYATSNVASCVDTANRETFLCPMIESPNALKQARAIAEVEGIDMLFFGPGDFSVLSGLRAPLDHPSVMAACKEACDAALAAGKRFGSLALTVEQGKRLLEMGASFLVCYSDMYALNSSFQNLHNQLSTLGIASPR